MPRPHVQIPLDYQTHVLPPRIITLLDELASHRAIFWCRELEELFCTFSGWFDAMRLFCEGCADGTAWIEDGAEGTLKPEWLGLYTNYASTY
ncbi:hypothetical protein JCM10207_003006 [Rhodosporidiobolus poonsookiae]